VGADDGPAWFLSEVIPRLRGARRGKGNGQWYACCPVPRHNDRHQSFAIKPGDKMPLVYHCNVCDDEEARAALAAAGVPEQFLGDYGTPEYEHTRHRRQTSMERLKLDAITGLLHEDMTPAMLKINIQAVCEDVAIPSERKAFIALAGRAGVKSSQRYEAWKLWEAKFDAGDQVNPGSRNNVVPTPKAEILSNVQVSKPAQIPETEKTFRKPEDQFSGNRKSLTVRPRDESQLSPDRPKRTRKAA
jgi:hypothetical protein